MPAEDDWLENSSEIECARCGERFFYELTHCPDCGVSVYRGELDEDDWDASAPSPGTQVWGALGAVAGGWLLGSILAGAAYFGIQAAGTPGSALTRALQFAAVPLGAFVGGYFVGVTLSRPPKLYGLGVGALSIGTAILLTAYERDLAIEPLIRGETLPWWALTALAGWWAAGLAHKRQERAQVARFFSPRSEAELYQDLLAKVGFDKDTAERLIQYEHARAPNATRQTLLRSAVDRWQRDNR